MAKLSRELQSHTPSEKIQLTYASHLPGWHVQKDKRAPATYSLWPASCRDPEMPWTVPPCPHRKVSREQAIEVLRGEWTEDFETWLAEGGLEILKKSRK